MYINRLIENPYRIFSVLAAHHCFNNMSDKTYLSMMFRALVGRKLNWDNPSTYNEKLQWLKIYDRKPFYTTIVDKYAVRPYIEQIIGKEYLIPLLGVWNNAMDIDFSQLPQQFVLKCNHNSGNGMCICTDKNKLDVQRVIENLEKGLKENYYLSSREWPYKNVKRKIIAEAFIGEDGKVPLDYKLYCFDGKVDSIMVCVGRDVGYPKFYFYSTEWKRLLYQKDEPESPAELDRPEALDEMVRIAEKLSKNFAELRVDLYYVNGKIYFGEMTLFNQSGFDIDITYETDLRFGQKTRLSNSGKL